MDPERVPPLPQSETTSPVHALDEDPFNPSHSYIPRMTTRIETSKLSPYAGNVPTETLSPEKSEVSEILSLKHNNDYIYIYILRSLYDHLYLFDFPNQIPREGKLE